MENNRVLVFLPLFTLGGAEWQGFLVAKNLQRLGFNIEVWGFSNGQLTEHLKDYLRAEGIAFRAIAEPSLGAWKGMYLRKNLLAVVWSILSTARAVTSYGKLLPRSDFDFIFPFTPMPSLVSLIYRGSLGNPVVYWNHRGGLDSGGFNYSKALVAFVKWRKPGYLANSLGGAQFLAETFGIPLETVKIIRNIAPLGTSDLDTMRLTRKTGEVVTMVHVANFYPEKDILTVISAAAMLMKSNYRFRLLIIGRPESLSYLSECESLINEHGISDYVSFLGALDRKTTIAHLRSADIGILSSRSEGCPNAVLEYMSAGLPVVATNIPSIEDILPRLSLAFLFDIGDARSCFESLEALITNETLRHQLGIANKIHVEKNFSEDSISEEWCQLVSE